MKTKVLIYNIMEFPDKISLFNAGIEREVEQLGLDADYFVFDADNLPKNTSTYTHLIISGSESSAAAESPWTANLTQLIFDFVEADKKILAICYGHQFLARVLGDKSCVYKMPFPEYGYSKIDLKENPLFDGIIDPVVLELHNDAVRNLSNDFDVIARNETSIQAFQYKGKLVYGVQFHPEFDQEAAHYFFDEIRKLNPDFPNFFRDDLKDESKRIQNRKVIQNFLKM